MRRLLTVLAASVPLAAAVYLPAASADTGGSASSAPLACTAPSVKAPAGTKVEDVTVVRHAAGPVDEPSAVGTQHFDLPAYCNVTVTLTHPGDGDHAKVNIRLPLRDWNGRLRTIGGSAFAAGDPGAGLAAALKGGYAAATTDAGVGGSLDTSWALNGKGQVDRALLKNFASRSEHETAVVAKEVIAGFYGKSARYSYFTGCSTGGRQGYAEAQRYPGDYDGIAADAPAVNWDEFEVATLWPQVVMNQEKTYPSGCEFDAFNAAAVKACDALDGAEDGLIGDPARCGFDPRRLIGTKVDCEGGRKTITAADAAVVRRIWDGPRTSSGKKLWAGVPLDAPLKYPYLAGIDTSTGTVKGAPFPVPAAWVATWLKKQPAFDVSTITYDQFTKLFKQSEAEYDEIIGTDDPDLSAFRKSGGKLLSYHGQSDQLIPTQGTVDYRERVEHKLGGTRRVDDFYRLFLAPGTQHCGLDGQNAELKALTAWVEHGKAPRTLPATLTTASGQAVTRDLCTYPLVPHYKGHGDVADASSFRCVTPSRH